MARTHRQNKAPRQNTSNPKKKVTAKPQIEKQRHQPDPPTMVRTQRQTPEIEQQHHQPARPTTARQAKPARSGTNTQKKTITTFHPSGSESRGLIQISTSASLIAMPRKKAPRVQAFSKKLKSFAGSPDSSAEELDESVEELVAGMQTKLRVDDGEGLGSTLLGKLAGERRARKVQAREAERERVEEIWKNDPEVGMAGKGGKGAVKGRREEKPIGWLLM